MGQRDEINTIKLRSISLNLSDADVKRLCEKAGRAGLTVSSLLENFIGDLVDGTYSNGSDERMYASEWFDRCWFGGYPEDTFLRYLISEGVIESAIDEWNEIDYYKKLENPDESDKEDLMYYEECINDRVEQFQKYRRDGDEKFTLESEMEKVLYWWKQYEELLE